jgi:Mg-chelatase subunit ChlD
MRSLLAVTLLLLFFACSYGAADTSPISVLIQTQQYGIANGVDTTPISINIVNSSTNQPIAGLPLDISLVNPSYGVITPQNTVTDISGSAQTMFIADNKTGKADFNTIVDYYGQLLDPIPGSIIVQGYPDTINLNGTPEWLVAGDTANSSLITVEVKNRTNPDPMLNVRFSLLDPTRGSLTVTSTATDLQGKATTRFTPSTRSGDAIIRVNVTYRENGNEQYILTYYTQKVDHAAPYRMSLYDAPSEMFVGQNTNLTVYYVDVYNNPIDNKRYSESVRFSVTSPSSTAGFWNGTAYSTIPLNVTLNAEGAAVTDIKVDNLPGINKVTVHPLFSGVADTTINILGIAGAPPVIIEQYFSSYAMPDPYPNIPADAATVFNITYTLRDQYGNGVRNRSFWMNTTLGEEESRLLVTNSSGMVKVTYGPKIRTDIINITVEAVDAKPDGTRAFNWTNVEITSTEPVQMVLTGSPQYIPSWDVPGSKTANIRAVVMDRYGNPVKGQQVNFTVVPASWTYNYISAGVTGPKWRDYAPSTVSLTTVTHDSPLDAYASLEFQPGYFPNFGDPPAHDACTLTAKWGSYPTQSLKINWTNVPFLSISTNVTPLVAQWDDIVTVNVKVEGNGYRLKRKPVDVMLLLDTSGSMKWDIAHDYGSSNQRLTAAKTAAKNFIGNMQEGDRVGLVTFASDATLRHGLTDLPSFSVVNATINSLTASGATNMRKAFKLGIDELNTTGRPDALKAVILLSDGEWNYDGSPVAHGTGWLDGSSYTFSGSSLEANNYRYYPGYGGTLELYCRNVWNGYRWVWTCDNVCYNGEGTTQNMSRYANASSVRIYDIFFASSPSPTVVTTLSAMANANSGFYEYAPSAEKLNEIFERIAGVLKVDAGIGVTMDLPFDDIKVTTNVSSWSVNGTEAFTYIPYTEILKYWFNTTPRVNINPPMYRDDTTNWSANQLSFNIGTIKLNQTWESTFKLKVNNNLLNVGRITLFDESSKISFSDGKQNFELGLPTTYITCIGNQSETQQSSEEAGYVVTYTNITNTIVTEEFTRTFYVNGSAWNEPWYRTWYENYYIDIPGYLGKTKIGSRTIPAPVPLSGSYTFDLKPYLPPGVTTVDFNFYPEGTDGVISGFTRNMSRLSLDPGKIYIMLQ